ncbi:MAG: polyprenyl synthetase family protein [Phycisphaerae bacterium]|nr:polyprenyl synthetase family protein [Phycisphaerae bacterium]
MPSDRTAIERTDSPGGGQLPSLFRVTAERVEAALAADLDGWLPRVPASLGEAIRYALMGPGKRIRPVLLLWSAEVAGRNRAGAGDGPARDAGAMPAAVAIEMLHTYSLVHDDLPAMDDDALRRGRPTCHVVYGEGVAVLVGDALLTRAFEVLAGSGLPADRIARLVAALGEAGGAAGMIGGQAEDLAHEQCGGDLRTVEYIHEHKTAALLSAACRMGAIVGGAGEKVERLLAEFGRAIGIAFQIADDLLDEVGQTAELGKQAGKDRAAGKLTYPRVAGVEASRRAAAEWLGRANAVLDELALDAAKSPERALLLNDLRATARYVIERSR